MNRNTDDQFLFNSTKPTAAKIDWHRLWPWLVGVLGLILALVLIFWLWKNFSLKSRPKPAVIATSTTSLADLGNKLNANNQVATATVEKNEEISFGDFYIQPAQSGLVKAKGVNLPLNIKEQTANYYNLNREIVLTTDQLKKVNQNGYVVIDNPFPKEAKDFFSMYATLNKKNLPFLVTNDFLFYYYQNTLKSIYKQLESDLFYKEAWEFNKAMFELANQRYLDRYSKVGLINDTVLEAMRLESAYFAVSLELLKVKSNQVTPASKDSVATKEWLKLQFDEREADYYKFTVPEYLRLDVNKELALIIKGAANSKLTLSPVMLYQRDYRDFAVPKEYEKNYRLINFYQSFQWLKNNFPLYYQSPECPDCFLDKSDWMINQGAAHLIARDLATHRDLKNQWAKIYKAYSYFSGLRSELTYIDYSNSFTKVFGETVEKNEGSQSGRTIEQVFDTANPNREQELLKLRDEIATIQFDSAKGSYNKQTALGKFKSGLRVIQEDYWPTQYIFEQLTFDNAGPYLGDVKKLDRNIDKTQCTTSPSSAVRCRAIGFDIINPIYNEQITNDYFVANSRYKNYFNQTPALRRHFDNFDTRAWHQSFFWSNLHAAQQFLNTRKIDNFNYTKTNDWSNIVLTTALGSMINSKLPYDQWKYSYQQINGLNGQELIKYNFVEPNLVLVNELLANSKMVFNSFVKLGLIKENHQEFNDLFTDLESVRRLIIKERNGEEADFTDWSFVNGLVNKYYVSKEGSKVSNIDFIDPANPTKDYLMEQSLSGLKLLITVQFHQGRNLIVAGPVFNFNERTK